MILCFAERLVNVSEINIVLTAVGRIYLGVFRLVISKQHPYGGGGESPKPCFFQTNYKLIKMKTNKINATFDCRVWKKDTPRQSRQMVEAGNRINLSCRFDEGEITEEMKEFAHYSEKTGKYYINVKVFPKNCKIYTASAKQVDFPAYDKIDGGRFEVIVDFTIKHGTGTELNGLYANAIQIIRRADVPFEPVDGGNDNFLDGGKADPFSYNVDETTDLPF